MSEPADPSVRKTVSLPTSLWRQIEDFQFENRIKRDAEAVRTLIQRGLDADKPGSQQTSRSVGMKSSPGDGPSVKRL